LPTPSPFPRQLFLKDDILAGDEPARFDSAVEATRKDLPDRNSERVECSPSLPSDFVSLFAQLPLLRHVLVVQRVNILLSGVRGAMTKDDDVAALLQRRQ
jgi:hypothetical protein